MSAVQECLAPATTVSPNRRRTVISSRELGRGAMLNTVAMLSSNFRSIFILLIARFLGAVSLGIFSVAWATADLVSKLGVWGLDDATTALVARAEAAGEFQRSRALFQASLIVAIGLSLLVALLFMAGAQRFGQSLGMNAQLVTALSVIVWALPGIALYRVSNAVSRGMKVMKHDIFSRGITESAATTVAFLAAIGLGLTTLAPEFAAIAGTGASGIVASIFAIGLFRHLPGPAASTLGETKRLLAYTWPIGMDQFLNACIWRLDVIILGCFVGHAPGVTLTSLGIYCAVVGLANGLRKVSQPFTPIFAPVVAGMTANGEHHEAASTYARLLGWMLWILLPFVAVIVLAGPAVLLLFGPGFEQGNQWLSIVAIACATNAFVNLGETVIMVQRPGLNLLNSLVTAVTGSIATLLLIAKLGVIGAAFGILITYVVQGIGRAIILRFVFMWPNPVRKLRPVLISTVVAFVPAAVCRLQWDGVAGGVIAAVVCLVLFGAGALFFRRPESQLG